MGLFKPKTPKPPTMPEQPTMEDAGRSANEAVKRERQKRGYAAQLLTQGGAAGVADLGPIGTRTLLGGFG